MPNPIERTFEIVELHEQILTNLPVRNLFSVQRVSKTWNSVINRSTRLQKKMFLLPVSDAIKPERYPQCKAFNGYRWRYNCSFFPNPVPCMSRIHDDADKEIWADTGDDNTGMKQCLVRLDNSFSNELDYARWPFCCAWVRCWNVDTTPPQNLPPQAFDAGCASWQRMYVTQPPVTAVPVWHYSTWNIWDGYDRPPHEDHDYEKFDVMTIYNPNGITFRDFYEAEVLYEREPSSTAVDVGENLRSSCHISAKRPPGDKRERKRFRRCQWQTEKVKDWCDCLKMLKVGL